VIKEDFKIFLNLYLLENQLIIIIITIINSILLINIAVIIVISVVHSFNGVLQNRKKKHKNWVREFVRRGKNC